MPSRYLTKRHPPLRTSALIKLFSTIGMSQIVHSDQGRNFESAILKQSLEAFGISKSHTTAYHPEGDGMVERFNCTLLQLLWTYVEQESEWKEHLPLALMHTVQQFTQLQECPHMF